MTNKKMHSIIHLSHKIRENTFKYNTMHTITQQMSLNITIDINRNQT